MESKNQKNSNNPFKHFSGRLFEVMLWLCFGLLTSVFHKQLKEIASFFHEQHTYLTFLILAASFLFLAILAIATRRTKPKLSYFLFSMAVFIVICFKFIYFE